MEDILTRFKPLIKIPEDEVSLHIELATQSVLDYTNRIVLLSAMYPLVIELANYNYSHQGDIVVSRSEGAISETFAVDTTTGIPSMIRARLDRYKLLHVAQHR